MADKATRAPASLGTSTAMVAAAQRRGLLVGRNADTAAGLDNVLAVAPPLSLTDEDADHIVAALAGAFADTDAPAPPDEAAGAKGESA